MSRWAPGSTDQYGAAPASAYLPHSHDAATILLQAIEEVAVSDGDTLHIDRARLREALTGLTGFNGMIGVISCDEFGACTTTTPAASRQPKPKTSTTVNNTQATRLRLKPNSLRETRGGSELSVSKKEVRRQPRVLSPRCVVLGPPLRLPYGKLSRHQHTSLPHRESCGNLASEERHGPDGAPPLGRAHLHFSASAPRGPAAVRVPCLCSSSHQGLDARLECAHMGPGVGRNPAVSGTPAL